MSDLLEIGYIGLFLTAFLAATVVPFSSEALFGAMLLGPFNFTACIVVASLGNWLGGVTSYYVGYLGKWEWLEKYFKINKEKVYSFKKYLDRYGSFLGLMCWLPFVGDPIAVALGFFRVKPFQVFIAMLIGKAAKYTILAYLIMLAPR